MADSYFEDGTELTAPVGDEAIPLTYDPTGSPADYYITPNNLLKNVTNLTEDASPDAASDYVLSYDTSTSTAKKVLMENVSSTSWLRAWVNFNGTGTVAIRDDYGVDSITDNSTGDYTINFSPALPSANYAAAFSVGGTTTGITARFYDDTTPRSTTALRILTLNTSHALVDIVQINVIIVED